MSDLSQHDPFYIGPLFGASTLSSEKDWAGGMQTISLGSGDNSSLLSAINALGDDNDDILSALNNLSISFTTPPQPILNFVNPIISNGVYTITVEEGREYGIEISGDFGGGDVDLTSDNDTLIYQFTEPSSKSLISITDTLEINVSGASTPNIIVDITPVIL